MIREGIAAQIGQRSTLPQSLSLTIRQMNQPNFSCGIDASGSSCRLFEMEQTLLYFVFQFFNLLILQLILWEFRIFLEVRLAFLEEGLTTLLRLVEEVVEHGAVAGKFLDTSLTVKFSIKASLDHTKSQR